MSSEVGSVFTTPNASAGIAKVLKPCVGFEEIFQGRPARTGLSAAAPIPFFDWEGAMPPTSLVSPLAGKEGFDEDLISMVTVPFGSVLQLAIPALTKDIEGFVSGVTYRYSIVWRWSSTKSYVDQNSARYSIGQDRVGAPDAGSPRVVLLAASQSVEFLQTEGSLGAQATIRTKQFDVIGPPGQIARPFLTATRQAVLMQGVIDSSFPFFNGAPYMITSPIFCAADEMLLLAERVPAVDSESDTWDFLNSTATDFQFSNLFGVGGTPPTHTNYPTAGIYLWSVASGAGP